MEKKAASGIMLTLLLTSMVILAFNIHPVKAGETIYIRADGSVDPPTPLIFSTDNVTYTFTGNISDEIIVERNNIIVDGNGYTLQGSGSGIQLLLGRSNVTIKNMEIKTYGRGIWLNGSSNNIISGNNITANEYGILLENSSYNIISGNNVSGNTWAGIWLNGSSGKNIIENNTISESTFGIHLIYSWNNVIENNTIFNISYPGINIQLSSNSIIRNNTIFNIKEGGIRLQARCFNNIIEDNNIRRANYDGIELNYAGNNTLANNEINDVGYGILMYGSSNNTIVNNNISKGDRGIILYISSKNNTIRSNTISSFHWGISLHYSSDGNNITNNDLFLYDLSILLDNSSGNIVYHNNFRWYYFQARYRAYDDGSNQLDYNYWGDYTGLDTDGDGVGDEAYYIYPNGVDNHPLMNPMAFELSQVPGLHPIAYKEILEEPYIVTGEQTIENETITVSTRIDVAPSSTLTLRNVTLTIEGGGSWAGIFVDTGGSLFIYQCVITGKGFTVVARPYSTFVMRDSELHGCGVSLVESLKILTDGAVVENNLITNSHEGVCIFSSSCSVVNNRILSTFRGISIEGSGNIIMNNTIVGCVEDGIFVYGAGAVNNIIKNNFISDVWRNCIGGDAAENNVIMGNTLSNSPPDEFEPAKFIFSNLSINPTEVEAGNTVFVSVKVTNIGNQEGSYTIELKIAGEFVDSKTVTLEGGRSTTVSFTVIKEEAGSYDVDIEGQTGTLVVTTDITKPTADAGSDRTVNEDTPITLDGSASSDKVAITAYTWTFTDVTVKTLTGEKPTYTFSTPGVYTVTLNVTDAAGNWATATVIITVLDATKPVANAGQDQYVYVGATVAFDASGSTDNVGIISYQWDFGDGTTGTGKTTSHIYANPGTYTVTLTVKDAANNSATDSVTVTVLSTEVFPMWIIGAAIAAIVIATGVTLFLRKRK